MSSSVPRRQREDESEETTQPPPLTQPQHEGIAPPPAIPILPVSSHVSVPTAPITTVADLKKTVGSAPTHVAAATCVMFLVNREKLDAWKEVLGNEEDQRILARDVRVYHCVIDVDAAPEALGMVRPGEDIEIPSAHVFRHDGKGWKKHSEKSVSKPIDLTSLLCIAPVHDFSHLHNRIAEAHSRGVTHLVTYSGATWCPPCRRIMPFIASIIDVLNAKLASKGSVIEVVKIDRDAAEAIDQVYGVEYIPFFQVFRTADAAAHAAALDFDLPALRPEEPTDAEWEAGLAEARAVAQKPIASLQDSTPEKVAQFLETHCTPLSFNEEF